MLHYMTYVATYICQYAHVWYGVMSQYTWYRVSYSNHIDLLSDTAEVIETRTNEQAGGRVEYYVHYEGCE